MPETDVELSPAHYLREYGNHSVGIALSGGGLRAASFSLGALQALNVKMGLLRGPRAAKWISAVSGGSYIASAITLLNAGSRARYVDDEPIGAVDLAANEAPFAPGSPEAAHVLRHSSYLVEDGGWRTATKIGWLLFASFLSLAVLLCWIGVMLIADLTMVSLMTHGWIEGWAGPKPSWMADPLAQWALGVGGVVLFVLLFRSGLRMEATGRFMAKTRATLLRLLALIVLLLAIPFLTARIFASPILSSPAWIADYWLVITIAAVGFGLLVITLRWLARIRALAILGALASGLVATVAAVLPWALAILVICWVGTFAWMEYLRHALAGDEDEGGRMVLGLVGFFAVLIAAVVFYWLPGAISPHRPYRQLLSRCFAVMRTSSNEVAAAVKPEEIALSSLKPSYDQVAYPELVICAAANVSDTGAAPAGSNVLPLVIDSRWVMVGTDRRQRIPVEQMERLKSPSKRRFGVAPQPTLSVASAIAIAGAAVSPAMGRHSIPHLRSMLASLNVRLGVWLPNPMSPQAREDVAEGKSAQFDVGSNHLVMEMVGAHKSTARIVYASDGGHYENLGIVELMRRRCNVIWAIDASADPRGRASSLAQSIMIAESEIGCLIDIDLDVFALNERNRPRTTSVTGTITYPAHEGLPPATLHVLKLGVSDDHSPVIREYERQDPGFPLHATIQQVYSAERFEAYRRLGYETATLLVKNLPAPPEAGSEEIANRFQG
ncbi:DUF3488 domain-containing protein [Microbacterium sp. Leaf288]|uniref:DUF3488 domain-containing protein n=1 Tax=Microbacterium sp. Leaf288 TaxID=1736323 RepID=UPI0012FA3186|nr:hypothetical protein [Microbacterium sp. Leaf288]